jgi:pimeloyl-ACP methyl ester carboxylesterase
MLIMRKIIFFALMISTLLGLIGCQSLWYQFLNIVVDIAPDRFVIEEDHEKLSIPIVTSHPLDKNNNETEYLIIMIHGAGLNANKTFETGQQIIESLKMPKDRFWVLAPQFIEGVKLDEKGLLFWDRRWRSGGMSLSTGLNKDLPSLSSFEVIDRLIDVSTKLNPGIRRIIILGHSAGGQFIVRYAAINSRHEFLEQQGISIRYVVANSSSYPYLDQTRFHFNSAGEILITSREELMNCRSYNKYKYGLEELYGYAETLSPQIIRTRLLTRPVMFVLGTADTDRGWSQDKSCEADVQGKNRYERGLLYKHHLGNFEKISFESPHIWLEIPEVGHDATEIFTHPRFITELKTLDF